MKTALDSLRPREKSIWGWHEEIPAETFIDERITLLRVYGCTLSENVVRSVQNALATGVMVRFETRIVHEAFLAHRPRLAQQVTTRRG